MGRAKGIDSNKVSLLELSMPEGSLKEPAVSIAFSMGSKRLESAWP
jgi:hypothetical protein